MARAGPRVVLCLVAELVVAAAVLLAFGGRQPARQDFQKLVHGLAFGPAVDLAHGDGTPIRPEGAEGQ